MNSGNIYNEMMDDMYNRTMMIFTMRYNKWDDYDIYNEALMMFTRSNDLFKTDPFPQLVAII